MTGEIVTTLVGNLGADPELRFTSNSVPVAKFRMANTPRKREGDKFVNAEPTWVTVTCWRDMAQNVAESLHRGDRVVAHGTLENREYTDKDGNKRTSLELNAWALGPDLTFRTATIGDNAGDSGKQRSGGNGGGNDDPWGQASPQRPAATQGQPARTAEQQRRQQAPDEEAPW